MAKTIPMIGEMLIAGVNPAPIQFAKVTIGAASTNDVVVSAQATYDILTVPAGCLIHEIKAHVATAFSSSVTLTVGDSDSAAGFLASADITPTSSGVILASSLSAGEAMAGGKYYPAAQPLQIVVGGATPAAGKLDMFIAYSMLGDL